MEDPTVIKDTVDIHDKNTTQKRPFALNVVTVDSKRSYLLLTKNESGTVDRGDVLIESELITKSLDEYYDRLWNKSTSVMEHGVYIKNPWIPTNQKTS